MLKNTAGQKWRVFACDALGNPVTTAAAAITATIDKDWAGPVATDDANPTAATGGYYDFDLLTAETNADVLALVVSCATEGVYVVAVPPVIYTAGEVIGALLETDIDSTGSPVTLKKAVEVILARLAGKAAYDADTGIWTIKGADGSTTVLSLTMTGPGVRTGSVIS
ncbi:MAG: hypothetical protein PHU85_10435 [Phycisphaerae bacterium]|nr:hypothetical protein [Phycisphaerae bacterium]